MRRPAYGAGFSLLLACTLLSALAGLPGRANATPSTLGSPLTLGTPLALGRSATPITNVVIIYQENHSFDELLGSVCQTRDVPCNGYTGPVTFADGKRAANIVEPDIVPFVGHNPDAQTFALSNKWDQVSGCSSPPYPCVSHVLRTDIANLATLADTFTVSDATFAAGRPASFGAHVNLAAGTMDGYVGYNPHQSQTGEPPGEGWGRPSHKDALWRSATTGRQSLQPSCVPGQNHHGPYRRSPVPYTATSWNGSRPPGGPGASTRAPPKTPR